MQVFKKKLSDVECIGKIRNSLKKRWSHFYLLLFLAIIIFLAASFMLNHLSREITSILKDTANSIQATYDNLSFIWGLTLGLSIGTLFFISVSLFAYAFKTLLDRQKDELLLKYFEEARRIS